MKKFFDPVFILAFFIALFLFIGERIEKDKQIEVNKKYVARINYCDSVNELNSVAHQQDSILIQQLYKSHTNH